MNVSGQSQDDISLNKSKAKKNSLESESIIDDKNLFLKLEVGSLPNLSSHNSPEEKIFKRNKRCHFDSFVYDTKISSYVPCKETTAELCMIANEVHSKSSDKVTNFSFVTKQKNKQYHSWPKQYGKHKEIPKTTSYHNFGLNHDNLHSTKFSAKSCIGSLKLSESIISENKLKKNERYNQNIVFKSSKGDLNSTKEGKPAKLKFDKENVEILENFQNNNNDKRISRRTLTVKSKKTNINEDIGICKQKDPNLDECEKDAVESAPQHDDSIDALSSSSYEDSDWDSGLGQSSELNPLLYPANGISPPLFKKRKDLVLQWFDDFSDEQKNIFIQDLLGSCGLPQTHMLSLKLEPILHHGCPINCQDMLQWLPENVVYNILQYLDPRSLSNASLVNRVWYEYTCNDQLWQRFCRYSQYQLSTVRHIEQLEKHRTDNARINWRNVFIERYSCKRNWMKGKCKVKTFVGHTQGVSCVQFDSKRIVSGSSDKTIKVWDLTSESNEPVLTLVGHSGTVRCLQLSGNRLISGSADATIKVWDLSVGCDWNMAACRVTMVGHLDTVRCLQVDDEKVISGSYDMTLKVWELKSGRCKLTLRGHNAGVLCVQFDEEKIISGSSDNTIKVWNLFSGACLATLHGHQDAVTCLQFNHHKIISGSLDCTLKFWDLNSRQCIGTIDWIRSEGHTRVVRCLQADNWKIVSAGDDKTLKIWSLKSGERFVTLHKHTDGVTCLQFDDVMIVSGSYDKTVKVWNFLPC